MRSRVWSAVLLFSCMPACGGSSATATATSTRAEEAEVEERPRREAAQPTPQEETPAREPRTPAAAREAVLRSTFGAELSIANSTALDVDGNGSEDGVYTLSGRGCFLVMTGRSDRIMFNLSGEGSGAAECQPSITVQSRVFLVVRRAENEGAARYLIWSIPAEGNPRVALDASFGSDASFTTLEDGSVRVSTRFADGTVHRLVRLTEDGSGSFASCWSMSERREAPAALGECNVPITAATRLLERESGRDGSAPADTAARTAAVLHAGTLRRRSERAYCVRVGDQLGYIFAPRRRLEGCPSSL